MATLVTDSGRKTPARLASSAVLGMQSDERLVDLVRGGHERAFDAIVARYRRPLTRFAARFLPESRTEDAVQQAFMNAHTALVGSDDPVNLKPWLYTITRNASLNMVRQNGWHYEQIPLEYDGVRRPDQIVDQKIELQTTVAAMGALPERQRDALVMREFEGRSYDEIALALGTGDGAVRQLLNRARASLRGAATLLTPPPIVARAAASLPPSDGRRLAEVFGSLGAAGIAKASATAVVAGTLVVGAIKAPLPLVTHDGGSPAKRAAHHRGAGKGAGALAATAAAAGKSHDTFASSPKSNDNPARSGHGDRGGSSHHANAVEHGSPGNVQSRSGSGRDDVRHSGSDDGSRTQSGSGGTRHSGSDDGTPSPSTRTETRSGSDDGARSGSGVSGSGTSGGSDGSTTSGSGTSGSTTSGGGSDDSTTMTTTTETHSGSTSGGGTSGSSGSSTSGSGSSGSDDGVSGSSTSGSGTSGTSGVPN